MDGSDASAGKKHPFRQKRRNETKRVRCSQCQKAFSNQQSLAIHEKTIHAKVREKFKCSHCQKIFNGSDSLSNHVRRFHSKEKLRCLQCQKAFSNQQSLARHEKTIHAKVREKLKCSQCQQIFNSREGLSNHVLRIHSKIREKFECSQCQKTFYNEQCLARHEKTIHAKVREKFTCSQCQKIFNGRDSLSNHVRRFHSKEKLRCLQCQKALSNQQSLARHEKMIHAKVREKFKCSQCQKIFNGRDSLSNHVQRFHSKEKLRCLQCQKALSNQQSLARHEKTIHAKVREKFKCSHCQKIFNRQDSLGVHIQRFHSKIREKVECSQCQKKFTGRRSLSDHVRRIHSKVRETIPCSLCDLKFLYEFSLRRHVGTVHVSLRETRDCSHCDKKFPTGISLTRHLKTVHAEKRETFPRGICGAELSDKRGSDRHLKTVHATVSFPRKLHREKYTHKSSLKRRTEAVHEESTSFFKCAHCNEKFVDKRSIIRHLAEAHPKRKKLFKSVIVPHAPLKTTIVDVSDGEDERKNTAEDTRHRSIKNAIRKKIGPESNRDGRKTTVKSHVESDDTFEMAEEITKPKPTPGLNDLKAKENYIRVERARNGEISPIATNEIRDQRRKSTEEPPTSRGVEDEITISSSVSNASPSSTSKNFDDDDGNKTTRRRIKTEERCAFEEVENLNLPRDLVEPSDLRDGGIGDAAEPIKYEEISLTIDDEVLERLEKISDEDEVIMLSSPSNRAPSLDKIHPNTAPNNLQRTNLVSFKDKNGNFIRELAEDREVIIEEDDFDDPKNIPNFSSDEDDVVTLSSPSNRARSQDKNHERRQKCISSLRDTERGNAFLQEIDRQRRNLTTMLSPSASTSNRPPAAPASVEKDENHYTKSLPSTSSLPPRPIACRVCSLSFEADDDELRLHLLRHLENFDGNGNVCPLCGFDCGSPKKMSDHFLTIHGNVKKLVCSFPDCVRCFWTKKEKTRHEKNHAGRWVPESPESGAP